MALESDSDEDRRATVLAWQRLQAEAARNRRQAAVSRAMLAEHAQKAYLAGAGSQLPPKPQPTPKQSAWGRLGAWLRSLAAWG